VTISDPDPDIHAPDRSVEHCLIVKGEWPSVDCQSKDVEYSSIVHDGKTVITSGLKDGFSADFILKR
jgi:hypothetical protein